MFKVFTKNCSVLLIILGLVFVNPIFINAQQEKDVVEIRKEIHEQEIRLKVKIPMREGNDITNSASGFAIWEFEEKVEIYTDKITNYKTYYILTAPHLIGEQNWDLANCEENNIRIFVCGYEDETIKAQVVAWEWTTACMLLKVSIPEKYLDKFPIKVVKLAQKVPIALDDSKYLGQNIPAVYFGGYPSGIPVANRGYISKYYYNSRFNAYTRLAKMAMADVEGFGGAGQSGAAVFNANLEVIGMIFGGPSFSGGNSVIIIPIDVIVERFLKQISELDKLNFPDFDLDKSIKYKPVCIYRPEKDKNN